MASVIIIGGGPAGVSAGLYTIRANIVNNYIYSRRKCLNKG